MSQKLRVLITTAPFGEPDRTPLDLLDQAKVDYTLNPFGRRLLEEELRELIRDFTVLIAGTEPITASVMENAPHLKLISRVGIGLDSVDLAAARRRGIQVCYTPDGPSDAVAELTVGLMLSLLRSIPQADRDIRLGTWRRYMGRRIARSTVGIIGVGRVGRKVAQCLSGFAPRILANDIQPNLSSNPNLHWVDKETVYREADIITVHVPLSSNTYNMVTKREISLMKRDAVLINTSRGGIVNEEDLATALRDKCIAAAAVDVFEAEPYSGKLATLENCLLTCHMGSMTLDCRLKMEVEAAEEAIRFIRNEPLTRIVPESEFDVFRTTVRIH